jgi:hypothetical protein
VIALRCTQKVLKRLGLSAPLPEPPAPTNALGHWYVNLLRFGHEQIVMATSERSLLTVVLPARELRSRLAPGLAESAMALLLAIGVPPDRARREIDAMTPTVWARTASKSVLGSMNDFAFNLEGYLHLGQSPMAAMLHMADTPMSALRESGFNFGRPGAVARELLAA